MRYGGFPKVSFDYKQCFLKVSAWFLHSARYSRQYLRQSLSCLLFYLPNTLKSRFYSADTLLGGQLNYATYNLLPDYNQGLSVVWFTDKNRNFLLLLPTSQSDMHSLFAFRRYVCIRLSKADVSLCYSTSNPSKEHLAIFYVMPHLTVF